MARLGYLRGMAGAAVVGAVMGAGMALLPGAAWAQKNSGPLLTPGAPAYAPPAYRPAPSFNPAPVTPGPAGQEGHNPDVERLAQTLPLDPQTRGLQNQEPADPRGTERRLGLREPRGPATDMRGRTPSPREIVNALAPR